MSSHTDSFVASGSSPTTSVCRHGIALESSCIFCGTYYEHKTYRSEIGKALAYAKRILADVDFEELVQDVDFEIWRATRRYDDQMNPQLAYQISKNQASAFLRKRIQSQTILVTDNEGNPVLDEFGAARGLNGAELKRQSEDPNAEPKERQKAKKLIQRYAQRYPRFVPLFQPVNDKSRSEDSDDELTEVRPVGRETSRFPERPGSNLLQTFLDLGGFPTLRRLVSTWHGDKRQVGEAMLEPNFTVRGVSGLDKSKVSRVRQVVLKNFRAFISP